MDIRLSSISTKYFKTFEKQSNYQKFPLYNYGKIESNTQKQEIQPIKDAFKKSNVNSKLVKHLDQKSHFSVLPNVPRNYDQVVDM